MPADGSAPKITANMGEGRRRWRDRFGLQARMTASYVVLTAAAVILVEVVAIAFSIPELLANQDLVTRVSQTASLDSDLVRVASTSTSQITLPDGFELGQKPPVTLTLVLSTDGHVLSTSSRQTVPIGSLALTAIPHLKSLEDAAGRGSRGVISDTLAGKVAWSLVSVVLDRGKPPGKFKDLAGYIYVQAPAPAQTLFSFDREKPLLATGLVILLLALPVGAVFGFLTTRDVVRRLKLAVARERQLVEKSARLAERSRISRELHDSISQDLFSLSLLAGGLEKALPADSPVRGEVRSLAETVQSTNREMRALLLELRPTTLEEKGLIPALEELTASYLQRLGIKIDADLESVPMTPAAELAALRIAQEGLANAIKHADATTIRLSMHSRGRLAEITVSDDGRGFDPGANGADHGLGLRLMRERVEELGGSLTVGSQPGAGTVVTATLPVARP